MNIIKQKLIQRNLAVACIQQIRGYLSTLNGAMIRTHRGFEIADSFASYPWMSWMQLDHEKYLL